MMEKCVRPQSVSPTLVNDKLVQSLGVNALLKWRCFKKYFGYQDPITVPPLREQCPNFKCHSLFKWVRHQWRNAWVISKTFSVDK